MTREEILSHVDHTLLKPEATWPQIQTLCDEAIANHTASICINTCYVRQAVEYMAGRIPVCCVVGFPLGAMDTASKAFEAKTAIENGAAEVDMVINIGRLKNKEYDAVREDIRAVKQAVGDTLGSQDHGDPLSGFGILADLLDSEHRAVPLPGRDRLCAQIQQPRPYRRYGLQLYASDGDLRKLRRRRHAARHMAQSRGPQETLRA